MKHIFALLLLASLSYAQLPERLLLASGQQLGSGARALGMAGTYTGIADDFSAVWWNPAGLAQVKRIEVQGSLVRSGFANTSTSSIAEREGETNVTRINNLGMVFPVPVYQGALSFALGYSQVTDYDRRTKATRVDNSGTQYAFDELESGRLGFWTLAGAVDVSPNLSLGGGLNYWRGFNEFTSIEREPDQNGPIVFEELIEDKLSAFNLSFGALYRPGRIARFGVSYQSPMSMELKEEWDYSGDTGYNDYRMTYPAVYRLGASVAPGRWLAAADLEYRDWNSLKFKSDTPFDGVTKAEANQEIKDTYESTTRLSLGGEYLFPAFGLRARAGYSFEPSNFKNAGDDADKGIFTLGMGVLIDRSVMLDVTARSTSYSETITSGLSEDIRSSQLLMTVSYRM
jgi:long-chain fatty acid transport protein